MFYVYVYLNRLKPGNFKYENITFDYEPFYVGKGKCDRYLFHLNKVKNGCKYKSSMKFDIIEENIKNNVDPIIIKYDGLSEDDSLNMEKYFITTIGRFDLQKGPLSNRNDGGFKPQDNYHHTNESKNKISISGKKRKPDERYTLISPENKLYENVKLSKFCLDNNLDYQKMRKSSNKGNIKPIRINSVNQAKSETINCVGWSVINKKIIKPTDNRNIKYKLISPENEEFIIYSDEISKKIISDLGLDFRLLRLYRNRGKIKIRNIDQCTKKESKNCQGWQFIDIKRDQYKFESTRKISWKITSNDGFVYLVDNLKEFCKKYNLSERTFRTFKNRGVISMQVRKSYNDKIKKTIGWKCESI